MMDALLGNLRLNEDVSLLDLHDDALQQVARAVQRDNGLPVFSRTSRRLCRVGRSLPVTLRLQGTQPYRTLGGLTAGSDLRFRAIQGLTAAAEEGAGCHLLREVLSQAAVLSSVTTLELSVSMPPDRDPAARRQEGCTDGQGVLVPVPNLQQLRQLKLTTCTLNTASATLLAELSALTSLEIMEDAEGIWGFKDAPTCDLSPLSNLGALVNFKVHWRMAPTPPAAADGRYALAPSLRRLSLKGDTAYWLLHLPACPHLEQLHLDYSGTYQHASAHPAAVLEVVARHTPGLQKLTCPYDSRAGFRKQLTGLATGTAVREQPLPAAAVAALASLQHLDVGRFLCVGDAEQWEALGHLKALTSLQGIIVEGAPPPGWHHRRVQQLGAVLRVPGHAARSVLLAFPAVRVADLRRFAAARALGGRELSPVSGMDNLAELVVDWSPAPPAAAAAAAAAAAGAAGTSTAAAAGSPTAAAQLYGLPRSLRCLQLKGRAAAGWLAHLPRCPYLEQLQYMYDEDNDTTHPQAVLELVAGCSPGLCSFICSNAAELAAQEVPEGQQRRPPPGVTLAPLTALQHLDAGCHLNVQEAADWEVLGRLGALTSLRGIVVYQAPPLQWQHSRVKQLAVALGGVEGEGAAQVLLAFPAVQQAHLYVKGKPELLPAAAAAAGGADSSVGTQQQQQQQQQGVPAELSSLTSLRLQYSEEYEDEVISAASHAAPILAAARGVVDLTFDGKCSAQQFNLQMPDLSGCSSVTRLRFGSSDAADGWDVVNMVRPLAPTLRVLELHNCQATSPRTVRWLQEALPRLKHVLFEECGRVEGHQAEREVLAWLRHQLRLGLTFSVSD